MWEKLSYEYVYNFFKKEGCELLEDVYVGNKTIMKYRCSCGNISKIKFNSFQQGRRCKKCGMKKMAEKQKYSYKDVKEMFEKENCVLISKDYKNNKSYLDYICSCGNRSKIILNSFLMGNRCARCGGNHKYTYEEVRDIFNKNNCVLVSNVYKGANFPLEYICSCGNQSITRLGRFLMGHRCKKCGYEKGADKNRYTYEDVKNIFKNGNCVLISTSYKNCELPLDYICECGEKNNITLHGFLMGHRCKKCGYKKNTGKNNTSYNPNLSDEDRKDRRLIPGYNDWIISVYKKDGWICQRCQMKKDSDGNIKKIHAHHIIGYADNEKLRTVVSNGITLCMKCHFGFHSIYGKININKRQLNEFIKTYSCIE